MPGRKKKDDNVLEMAELILQQLDEPIHYKVLADAMGGSATIPGQRPDQVLYSRLHQDVKNKGLNSAFRFLGDGIFCASTVDGVDLPEVIKPEIQNNAKPYDHETFVTRKKPTETTAAWEERLDKRTLPPVCGNCTFIRFKGPYALSRKRGFCNNYKQSGKCGVATDLAGCSGWIRRRDAQVANDDLAMSTVITAMEDAVKGRKKSATR
jgi:hypothetical protein